MEDDRGKDDAAVSRQPSLPLAWESEADETRLPDSGDKAKSRAAAPEVSASSDKHAEGRSRRKVSLAGQAAAGRERGAASTPTAAGSAAQDNVAERETFGAEGANGDQIGSGRRPMPEAKAEVESEESAGGEEAGRETAVEEARAGYGTESEESLPRGFGTTLKTARQRLDLQIAEVSRRTRIPKDFIEQVEAGEYQRLPPPVYSRSYIAQLCREYGLEPAACLRSYDRFASASQEPSEPGGGRPFRLIVGGDSEDGVTLSYAPRPADDFSDAEPGWLSALPRLAVIVAIAFLLLLVVGAVVAQQYRNYRMRRAERIGQVELAPTGESRLRELDELAPPQELPLRELPIPAD